MLRLRCTSVTAKRPETVPLLNPNEESGSYAVISGAKTFHGGCNTRSAAIAVRVPDEVARELFCRDVEIRMTVRGDAE